MFYAVIGPERSLHKFLGLEALYPFFYGNILGWTGFQSLVEGIQAAVSVLEGPAGGNDGIDILDGNANCRTGKIRKDLGEKGFLVSMAGESLEPTGIDGGCGAYTF